LNFVPFVAVSRHRAAGPGVPYRRSGSRGGMQCRAKPEAEGELSLYSLWVRPPWPPACCIATPEMGKHYAQWHSDCFIGMFLPPPPIGRKADIAGHVRAVGVLVAERPRIPCPPAGPGKQSGRSRCSCGPCSWLASLVGLVGLWPPLAQVLGWGSSCSCSTHVALCRPPNLRWSVVDSVGTSVRLLGSGVCDLSGGSYLHVCQPQEVLRVFLQVSTV